MLHVCYIADEVDALLSRRGESEHDAMRRLKNEFLQAFDGVGKHTHTHTHTTAHFCSDILGIHKGDGMGTCLAYTHHMNVHLLTFLLC